MGWTVTWLGKNGIQARHFKSFKEAHNFTMKLRDVVGLEITYERTQGVNA